MLMQLQFYNQAIMMPMNRMNCMNMMPMNNMGMPMPPPQGAYPPQQRPYPPQGSYHKSSFVYIFLRIIFFKEKGNKLFLFCFLFRSFIFKDANEKDKGNPIFFFLLISFA